MRRLLIGFLVGVLVVALWPVLWPGQTSRNAASPLLPHLRDITGRLVIGCGFDGLVSAPTVCVDGRTVGVYIDDTTPDIRSWVAKAVTRYRLVIVARAPGQRGCPYPQPPVLCAHEWYPYQSGFAPWEWGPMPRARAYILQWLYSFDGTPPTVLERQGLLRQARRFRPKLILLY